MRWFKHMCDASRDEKLMLLRGEFGMEGYGVYWMILERIGEKITPQCRNPEITADIKGWREISKLSPKKLRFFLDFCKKVELFSVFFEKNGENTITVSCPNMLKILDEYTVKGARNIRSVSGHSPPASVSNSVSVSSSIQDRTYNSSNKGSSVCENSKNLEFDQKTPFG